MRQQRGRLLETHGCCPRTRAVRQRDITVGHRPAGPSAQRKPDRQVGPPQERHPQGHVDGPGSQGPEPHRARGPGRPLPSAGGVGEENRKVHVAELRPAGAARVTAGRQVLGAPSGGKGLKRQEHGDQRWEGCLRLRQRRGHTEEARTGLRRPASPRRCHTPQEEPRECPVPPGVQASRALGLPPATDAPQVIVRESFTLSPLGFTPVCL